MSILRDGELVLYGFVGDDFFDEGFTAKSVVDALRDHGRDNDLDVRINSGGGFINDGVAIFNALSAHRGDVTVYVDAIAASSASVIAMAGDKIVMRKGALMMIHDPSRFTWGTAQDHERSVEELDRTGDQMASIYAERSGKKTDDVRSEMKDETWFTPAEAVAAGYADEQEGAKAVSASAFDYRLYANAPKELAALAKRQNWAFESKRDRVATAATKPSPKKEPPMPPEGTTGDSAVALESAKAEGASEAKARIKAIVTHDNAEDRTALAEHFAYETEMSVEAATAALAAAPVVAATPAEDGEEPQPKGQDPVAYEQRRLTASGQAAPTPGTPAKSSLVERAKARYATNREQ